MSNAGPYRLAPPLPPRPSKWRRRLRRWLGGAACAVVGHRWIERRSFFTGATSWRRLPPFHAMNGCDADCRRCGLEVRWFDEAAEQRARRDEMPKYVRNAMGELDQLDPERYGVAGEARLRDRLNVKRGAAVVAAATVGARFFLKRK